MIRYSLKCTEAHLFESWFQSAAAFDDLRRAQHLSCPICGSTNIEKTLMSPRVTTSRDAQKDAEPHGAHPQAQQDIVAPEPSVSVTPDMPSQQVHHTPDAASEQAAGLAEKIAELRAHVEQNSDYVGTEFTKEARAINEGEAPARSIYGEAKLEDAKALIDEGVPLVPLPFAPKRKLN